MNRKIFIGLFMGVLGIVLAVCCRMYEGVALTMSATLAWEDTKTQTETQPESTTKVIPTIEIIQETTTEPETTEETQAGPVLVDFSDRTPVDGKVLSYLTGEWIDAEKGRRRPIATMMSNDKASLPQYGINRASVVYEAPVEGEMNRYMSIIEDYDDLERIGSTRSCRTYYVYFAREFNAIYAHFGQSTFAKPYLEYIDNINGIESVGSVAFYRSKDRKAPHNAYTSGERLKKAIDKLGYSTEYSEEYAGHYRFAQEEYEFNSEYEGVMDAARILPGYPMNNPMFLFVPGEGKYLRYQYGGKHKGDEGDIYVENVIIQYCPAGTYATTQYLDINVHAQGENGYFFTNGKGIPITWEKDGEFGVTHYYGPDGEEIVLNKGKTWVCIVKSSDRGKLEVYGEE